MALFSNEALLGTDLDEVLEDFEFTIDERENASPRAGRVLPPDPRQADEDDYSALASGTRGRR